MTTNSWNVPLFDIDFDEAEESSVLEVLRSKWLTMGPKTQEFETLFSQYLGGNSKALAVSSCTAALHMSLLAQNIGPGDEIIISGLSFVASLNIITMTGATPVLADSKSIYDWNVSPDDITQKITPKTKAIIIVHLAGYPCEMKDIVDICISNNLVLIEDVAHAIGGSYKDQMCGTFGQTSCFSFFSNKNLSVGEGGMIVTTDEDLYNRLHLIRSHGMSSMTLDRHRQKSISYDVTLPGLNYRFDEIRAAIAIAQLNKLTKNNIKRANIVQTYLDRLSHLEEIIIPWVPLAKDIISSYHIFPILLSTKEERNNFIAFAGKKGIQTSIHYPAYNQFSYYRKIIQEKLLIAEEISERVVTLPLFPGITQKQIQLVTDSLKDFFTPFARKS